ncbi:MAG TPA: hypothetical protein PLI95_04475 [Polyangiaceae bacterium]|nr:hypothetical protein [Polyangiaceae bacterium]
MADAPLTLHPDVVRLMAENVALRDELARAYAQIERLGHVVKPHVLALYQVKLGAWEAKVLALECEVGRMRRKAQLIQADRNMGNPPDLAAIDARLDAEFLEWKARVADAVARVEAAQKYLRAVMSEEDAVEFRRLFHELVRALHPDMNPEQPEEHRVLWHRVMEAYANRDLDELRTLSVLLNGVKPSVETFDSIELLERERVRLKSGLAEVVERIEKTNAELPFSLQQKLEDDTWVEARRVDAERRIAELTAQRAFLEQELQLLMVFGHGAGSGPN